MPGQVTNNLRSTVIPILLVLVTLTGLGLWIYDDIAHQTVDDLIKEVLAFVIGVLGNQYGNQSGGQQARETTQTVLNGTQQTKAAP